MLTTQFFAMKIQRYMAEHGISESTLAKVAAKAFENGSRNPTAWRRQALSEQDVLASKMVNDPLRQYMFCSPGEGAVALVLARGARIGELTHEAGLSALGGVPHAALRLLRGVQPVDPDGLARRRRPPRRRRPRSSRPASARRTSTSRSCRTPSPAPRSCISPRPGSAGRGAGGADPERRDADRRPAPGQHGRRLPRLRRADRRLRPAPGARSRPAASRRRRRPADPRPGTRRLHPGLRGTRSERVHRPQHVSDTGALARSRRLVLPELLGHGRAGARRSAGAGLRRHRAHACRTARPRGAAGLGAGRPRRPAGDRVALLLHNGFEFPESLLACHRLGGVRRARSTSGWRRTRSPTSSATPAPSPSSPATRPDGLATAAAVELEVGPAYEAAIADVRAGGAGRRSHEHDPAMLCYTSGTTGRPKGAILSHANLVAATLSWIHEMRAGADDVWLSGQPLFHIGGINGLLPFLALGATSILLPTTGFDPDGRIGLIEAARGDHVHLRPHAVGRRLRQPGGRGHGSRAPAGRDVGRLAGAGLHARADGADLPGRGHRQRLRPDGDVRRHDAAQGA